MTHSGARWSSWGSSRRGRRRTGGGDSRDVRVGGIFAIAVAAKGAEIRGAHHVDGGAERWGGERGAHRGAAADVERVGIRRASRDVYAEFLSRDVSRRDASSVYFMRIARSMYYNINAEVWSLDASSSWARVRLVKYLTKDASSTASPNTLSNCDLVSCGTLSSAAESARPTSASP